MKRIILTALVLLLVSAFGFSFIAAQDETMMETHTCDSTLILLLYIAEHDYGFETMAMDLASFDKGQYAALFDEMMMMEEEMMDEDMGEEEMMEATEEMMMEEPMMDDMTMLPVLVVEGEDPACTALRAELDAFFYDYLVMGMGMMEEDMGE